MKQEIFLATFTDLIDGSGQRQTLRVSNVALPNLPEHIYPLWGVGGWRTSEIGLKQPNGLLLPFGVVEAEASQPIVVDNTKKTFDHLRSWSVDEKSLVQVDWAYASPAAVTPGSLNLLFGGRVARINPGGDELRFDLETSSLLSGPLHRRTFEGMGGQLEVGTSDMARVEVPSSPSLALGDAFTIQVRIELPDAPPAAERFLFARDGAYALSIFSTGLLVVKYKDAGSVNWRWHPVQPESYSLNEPLWITAVQDWPADSRRTWLHQDLIQDTVSGLTGGIAPGDGPLRIGYYSNLQHRVFFSAFRIWPFAFDEGQVADSLGPLSDDLASQAVIALDFNERIGSRVFDRSPNRLDGTIVQAPDPNLKWGSTRTGEETQAGQLIPVTVGRTLHAPLAPVDQKLNIYQAKVGFEDGSGVTGGVRFVYSKGVRLAPEVDRSGNANLSASGTIKLTTTINPIGASVTPPEALLAWFVEGQALDVSSENGTATGQHVVERLVESSFEQQWNRAPRIAVDSTFVNPGGPEFTQMTSPNPGFALEGRFVTVFLAAGAITADVAVAAEHDPLIFSNFWLDLENALTILLGQHGPKIAGVDFLGSYSNPKRSKAEMGAYWPEAVSVREAAEELLRSQLAWLLPSGETVTLLRFEDLINVPSSGRLEQGGALVSLEPALRQEVPEAVQVLFAKNYAPLGETDIPPSVDASARSFLASPWREVLSREPSGRRPVATVETALTLRSDAQAYGNRLQDLLDHGEVFQATVDPGGQLDAYPAFSKWTVVADRWLTAETDALILNRELVVGDDATLLELLLLVYEPGGGA